MNVEILRDHGFDVSCRRIDGDCDGTGFGDECVDFLVEGFE